MEKMTKTKRNGANWMLLLGVLLLLIAATLILGCASFAQPTNETRVSEYSGGVEGGYPLFVEGKATIRNGCRVVTEGAVAGCFRYTGETCTYESENCCKYESEGCGTSTQATP